MSEIIIDKKEESKITTIEEKLFAISKEKVSLSETRDSKNRGEKR